MPMNLPNKLTIVRIIMIPFFVFFLLTDFVAGSKWIATVLFCAASITDFLDGHIARKYNLVTNFGKFMDPLADKMLVSCAMRISSLTPLDARFFASCNKSSIGKLRYCPRMYGIIQ